MSQIDDLNTRIGEALDEVEKLSGSLKEIEELKSGLRNANARLLDNADQLEKLAVAMDSFRSALERSTNALSEAASELSRVEALKIREQLSSSVARLSELIESKSSQNLQSLRDAHANAKSELSAGVNRLDEGQRHILESATRSSKTQTKWMVALMATHVAATAAVVGLILTVVG